jgi:uncharacterized protein
MRLVNPLGIFPCSWVPRSVRVEQRILALVFLGFVWLPSAHAESSEGEITVRTIPFKQGQIEIAHAGSKEGALIVMIHGPPGGWDNFTGFLRDEELTSGALVVSMDRLGWGGSRVVDGSTVTDLREQAAAVAAVLGEFGERRPAIIVGHSLGGTVAAQVVLDYPELVDGALIVSASLDPAREKTTWYQAIGRWKIVRWALSEELVAADREIKALPGQLEAMTAGWESVKTPIIVLQGEKDKLVPIAHAGYPAKMAPLAVLETVRLPKQGHFVPWEQPQAMVDQIQRLLIRAQSR